MPLTKERKSELIEQYSGWLRQSNAVVMAEFPGVAAKHLYQLRVKLRETQSQLHVVKLTLFARSLAEAGLPVPQSLLTGTLIMGFAFEDPPALAKAMVDFAKDFNLFQIKGGWLGNRVIDPAGVKALAELPPKPVVLAGLLGTLQGPMSQLISVINAPLRELAQVLHARSEQGSAEAAA